MAETSLFTYQLPDQRTTRDAKGVRKFYQATYDNIISRAISLNDKTQVIDWLNAANGNISNSSIAYMVTPLIDDTTKQAIGKLPGEIRETDLINTVRERNLGEYIGLPYKFEVSVHNEDAVMLRDAKVKKEVDMVVQQAIINELNALYEQKVANGEEGLNLNVSTEEIPDIKEHIEKVVSDYFDDRAIQGQSLLELVNDINGFDIKRIQAFYYWWACEEFYTYREIVNGEVKMHVISPTDGFPIMGTEQFVEDGEAFVIRKKITLGELRSRYWDRLTKEEQDYINSLVKNKGGYYTVSPVFLRSRSLLSEERSHYHTNQNREFRVLNSDEMFDEYTIIWRTEVPITIKTTTDLYGDEIEEIVDEGYEPIDESEKVRKEWIEEVWIGKRFGDATSGVYLQPEPCAVQRYDRHTNRCKLPTGGKKGILIDVNQNPIPKRLISYELIDRIFGLQIERTIAKYQSHILAIPQSMINDDSTGTSKQKMFNIKADNTLIYDDTQVDFNIVTQGLRSIGLQPVAEHLRLLLDLKTHYREEGLQMANMNSYRLGDINPNAGKGVVQEGIYRASVGNVLAITMFNAALERDHNADLEFVKIAYVTGKKTSFYSKELKKVIYIDIDPFELLNADLGVTVHNAKIDQNKMDAYRNYAFSAAQNGEFELAAAAIEADTLPQIRKAIKDIVEAKKKLDAAMAQQQNESTRYAADLASQDKQAEIALKDKIAFNNNTTDILVAQINAGSKTESTPSTPESTPNTDASGILAQYNKEREMYMKKQMHDDIIREKQEDRKSKERIAKQNKNKYDK